MVIDIRDVPTELMDSYNTLPSKNNSLFWDEYVLEDDVYEMNRCFWSVLQFDTYKDADALFNDFLHIGGLELTEVAESKVGAPPNVGHAVNFLSNSSDK